ARNPVERIVPDHVAPGDLRPRHEERLRAEPGDPHLDPARALVDGERFALGPFPGPGSHARFVAQPDAGLRHGGERLVRRAESRDHHRRRASRHRVLLPRPGVAVAARPGIDAVAAALVAREAALVAVPGEGGARPPAVDPRAVLGVVREIALVTIAPGPGLHAAAVLPALVEFPDVDGASLCYALPVRLPVPAATGVRSLQLRLEHEATGRSLRAMR